MPDAIFFSTARYYKRNIRIDWRWSAQYILLGPKLKRFWQKNITSRNPGIDNANTGVVNKPNLVPLKKVYEKVYNYPPPEEMVIKKTGQFFEYSAIVARST